MRRTVFFTVVTEYFYFVNMGYKKKIYAKIEIFRKEEGNCIEKERITFWKINLVNLRGVGMNP